ncbi:MAG: queuosine precursor transporter [Eggerthellaceae bacterium]|nr:queuosine precursor transporter [Eggerthellaceae bacterium]
MNELLLIGTVPIYFGILLFVKRFWGLPGFSAYVAITAILANIEANKLIYAFGLEMTLGNVLFASQFLTSDIISESYGKHASMRVVYIGVFACTLFILTTQIMIAFVPSENDQIQFAMQNVFGKVPQVTIASLVTYFIVQRLDVFLYHHIWDHTFKHCGDRKAFLWVRNNVATITSQLINSLMFNFLAFFGTYQISTIVFISFSTFAVSFVLALLDTPFLYFLRMIRTVEFKGAQQK